MPYIHSSPPTVKHHHSWFSLLAVTPFTVVINRPYSPVEPAISPSSSKASPTNSASVDTLCSVEEPSVKIESVIRLKDETVMIGCNVRICAEISYYIERSNFVDVCDDIHPYVTNYQHNEHYLEVSNLIELNVDANIRTTKMLSKILTSEVIPRSISFVPYEVTKTREKVE